MRRQQLVLINAPSTIRIRTSLQASGVLIPMLYVMDRIAEVATLQREKEKKRTALSLSLSLLWVAASKVQDRRPKVCLCRSWSSTAFQKLRITLHYIALHYFALDKLDKKMFILLSCIIVLKAMDLRFYRFYWGVAVLKVIVAFVKLFTQCSPHPLSYFFSLFFFFFFFSDWFTCL